MLFRAKIPTENLAPLSDTTAIADAGDCPAKGADRPSIAHNGKIRLGGGCRLPLQGEPMERDRPRRGSLGGAE